MSSCAGPEHSSAFKSLSVNATTSGRGLGVIPASVLRRCTLKISDSFTVSAMSASVWPESQSCFATFLIIVVKAVGAVVTERTVCHQPCEKDIKMIPIP